jgi:hypothetical protein
MRILSSARFQRAVQARARFSRKLKRQPPAVHYFHQVDDPYSHLAVQKLDRLRDAYDLPFHPHLVSKPDPVFQGSSEHFDRWALRDAGSIAGAYDTRFPADPRTPDPVGVSAANDRLAARAGIDWIELQEASGGIDWEAVLDDNLQAMQAAGLWGVPSFWVTGGNDDGPFACWGQDRIWRVENEIAARARISS